MAEFINRQDTLNQGREKLNAAIRDAEKSKVDAGLATGIASQASSKAEQAVAHANSVQKQLDQIVVEGDSSVEAAAARVDEKGSAHTSLKARLDSGFSGVKQQLVETDELRRNESMVNRKEPDGLYCSWVDDDGHKGVYTKLLPLAREYGFHFTSSLITNSLNGTPMMTPEQRKESHESGYIEFLSHTHYHDNNRRPSQMTLEELDYDFRTSQKIIKDLGYNHRGVVLPFSDNSPNVQRVARRYFDYAIGTGAGMSGYPQYPGELDNYYIRRVTVEYGFDFVKEQLDAAKARGIAWVVFVSHVDQGDWYSEAYVRQIIEYALSLGFKSCTTQEGIERFGNIAQFGRNKIGADGSVKGNEIGKVQYKPLTEGVGVNTPITDFPKNVETFTDINTPNAQGFPLNLPGILKSKRYAEDAYSHQEYTTSRNYLNYVRGWNNDTSAWDEFVQKDFVRHFGLNGIKIDESPLSDRLRSRINYTFINSSGNSAFPEAKSGLYIVNALWAGNNFPTREYRIYGEPNKVYRSYWIDSEKRWSDFRLQPYYLPTLKRSNQTITISPHRTADIITNLSDIKTTQMVTVRANNALPTGLLMQAYVLEDGKLTIRLANITENPIALNGVDFEVLRIEGGF